jgi:hypothetical protein
MLPIAAGGKALGNFRLYRLDGAGKIASAEWLDADDEAQALDLARGLNATTTVEVWNRNKLIGRVEPGSKVS